jgi:photosystem II stability/assembly factor-like uncharacterized protein
LSNYSYNYLYQSTDGGKNWFQHDQEKVDGVFLFKNQLGMLADKTIFISKDKGKTWQATYTFDKPLSYFGTVTSNEETVWVRGDDNTLYLSNDLQHWDAYKNESDSYDTRTFISANKIYEVYAGKNSQEGFIKLSEDKGKTWTTLLGDIYQTPTAIASDGNNLILAAFSGSGIIQSSDNGKNWEVINHDLSNFYIKQIVIIDKTHYVLATEGGVFYTQDGGKHWTEENSGLLDTQINSLFMNEKMMLAGTREGVFKASI